MKAFAQMLSRPPPFSKNNKPTTDDEWRLPLHVKNLICIDWEEAEKIVIPSRRGEWTSAKQEMLDPSFLNRAVNACSEVTFGPYEADLTIDDGMKLTSNGYWEEWKGAMTDIKAWCRCRTEMEKRVDGKFTRRRFLAVPELFNFFYPEGSAPLQGVQSQIDDACEAEGGAFISDASAFYRQFEIPSPVRIFYGVSFRGKVYVLKTIATGQRQAPRLADALMYSIAWKSSQNYQPCTPGSLIDNLRLLGTMGLVTSATVILEMLLSKCRITMDIEQTNFFSHDYVFLGVHYQHETHVVKTSLSKKSLDKLAMWSAVEFDSLSLRGAMSWFGLMLWGARILDVIPATLYYFIKFFRRRVSGAQMTDESLEEPAKIWECIRNPWMKLHQFCLDNNPACRRRTQRSSLVKEIVYIFTDSCLSGWGVTIFFRGKIYVDYGPWGSAEDIQILEARSALRGISFFKRIFPPESQPHLRLKFFIDNTSFLGAVKRGMSKNFLLNYCSLIFREEMKDINIDWEIDFVPGSLNPADPPSRAFE